MKKLSLKLLTIALVLIMVMILLVLPSCKSHKALVENSSAVVQSGSSVVRSVDTVLVRDSVYVSERQKGDTVYLTRTEWRDRWRVRLVHDTVVDTQYVTQVVEKPPERYVPKFYKTSTTILWLLIAGLFVYVLMKIVLKRY